MYKSLYKKIKAWTYKLQFYKWKEFLWIVLTYLFTMKIYISKWSLHRDVDYFVVRTINRKLIKEEVSKIITVFQYVVKKKKKNVILKNIKKAE